MATDTYAEQLRAAALHDAVGRDDQVAYEVATGRPWRRELPDLLGCGGGHPCRLVDQTEREAVESVTGPIPAPGPAGPSPNSNGGR